MKVDIFHTVLDLQKLGLTIHPVEPRGKKPLGPWKTQTAKITSFREGQNIGARLGVDVAGRGFLADVDIDATGPGVAEIIREFLPPTGRVHGRKSKPSSHHWYVATEPIPLQQYKIGNRMLIELRCAAADDVAVQSVIAPGVHESGEPIEWEREGEFAQIAAETLRDSVRLAALALLIADVWPTEGSRHDARLAFSGLLLRGGVVAEDVERIVKPVVTATRGDVRDVRQAVIDTGAKLAAGQPVTGAAWIEEHLARGKEVTASIARILRPTSRAEADSFDVTNLDLKPLTPQVWRALEQANQPPLLFLQGGAPVRFVEVRHRTHEHPQARLEPIDRDRMLREVAERSAFHIVTRRGDTRTVPPPFQLLQTLLATPPQQIPLPTITRIVRAPIVAADGTLVTTPGYHVASGTYFVGHDLSIPVVSMAPSRDEVARAASTLNEPLIDFPFIGDPERAHALAFGLLPFGRELIDGPTPLHLFEKPTAGTGATLLTDVLLFPALGQEVAKLSEVRDDDEWRKQITSTLRQGSAAIVIDNVRSLTSTQLAKAITDRVWKARILGTNKDAEIAVQTVWGATGNNPEVHQEIARRTVRSRLDARTDTPFRNREFAISDLMAWSRINRNRMIWAALTLFRAWCAAGQPPGKRKLGGFERWSHVIGGVFEVAEIPGFLGNADEFYSASDVESEAERSFVVLWAREFGSTPVQTGQLFRLGVDDDGPLMTLVPEGMSARGVSTWFGKRLRRLRDKTFHIDNEKLTISHANGRHVLLGARRNLVDLSNLSTPSHSVDIGM